MTEWKTYKLGDILNFRRGYDLPKNSMESGDIPVAGSNGIIGYHNKCTPIFPCITIGRSGNVGTPHIYSTCWAHNTVLYVDDFKGNYPLYLYYLLQTIPLAAYGAGSAVPTLNRNHIHPIEVLHCTSIEEQKRIAGILSALDDKIELNRRINTNLEAQAMALYKQWFVDFEFPNSAGKPYKSSGGKMIDSDFGPIPAGWHKGTLSEIGNVIGGGTPSKENISYYTESGIAWITPKDLSISHNKFISKGANDITELGYRSSSAKLMPKGTVLFSSRAPIGYMAIAKNEVCTNQGFKSIIPQKHTAAFIYYFLKTNVEKIESQASGSTFKEASGTLMKSLEILVPDSECLQSFDTIMSQLFNMQESNEEEMQTLSTLRDILLPKLMDGEL